MSSDETVDNSSHDDRQLAIWTPGWYELDQTLALGVRQKLRFFETVSSTGNESLDQSAWLFFNQPDTSENCVTRFACVDEMHHPVLGELLRIDTDGLDYIFFPVDGEEIVVNAEEEPGSVYDGDVPITDWSVHVKLSNVSQRVENLV